MLRRIAMIVETLVLAAVIVTVVLMFTNSPTAPPAAPAAVAAAAPGVDSAGLYGDRCAGCHGGDGSGGIGPKLNGGRVVAQFPNTADQVAVVTDGRRGMPAFGARLTADEIAAIVEYTRAVLAAG